MDKKIQEAAVSAILGMKYVLFVISSTETMSLGVVRAQDLINFKEQGITLAGLWPGTALEIGAGWAVEEIMHISSGWVLENLQDNYVDFEALLEALPKAILRLEAKFAAA